MLFLTLQSTALPVEWQRILLFEVITYGFLYHHTELTPAVPLVHTVAVADHMRTNFVLCIFRDCSLRTIFKKSHNFVNDSLGLLYTTYWHMEDSGITNNFHSTG